MKKLIIVTIMLMLFGGSVNAALNPVPAFCEHQGYDYQVVRTEAGRFDYDICNFDKENQCDGQEFYNGDCGTEYKKEFSCRQEEELYFDQFETCCEGLESSFGWWNSREGQPRCVEKMNFFQKLWRWFK